MDTEQESTYKVNSEKEHSPAAPAGIRTRNLSITSPAILPFCPCSRKHVMGMLDPVKSVIHYCNCVGVNMIASVVARAGGCADVRT